jgi:hypothetical protein
MVKTPELGETIKPNSRAVLVNYVNGIFERIFKKV